MAAGTLTDDYVCDECGMDYGRHGPRELVFESRTFTDRWQGLTDGVDDAALRTRPDADTWSALEYGGHLGDVFAYMVDALGRMTAEDAPEIGWFDHEQAVADAGYDDRPVREVGARLGDQSAALTRQLAAIGDDEWERTATYPWGERDLLDMARNAVHEGVHHLHDVSRVLSAVTDA